QQTAELCQGGALRQTDSDRGEPQVAVHRVAKLLFANQGKSALWARFGVSAGQRKSAQQTKFGQAIFCCEQRHAALVHGLRAGGAERQGPHARQQRDARNDQGDEHFDEGESGRRVGWAHGSTRYWPSPARTRRTLFSPSCSSTCCGPEIHSSVKKAAAGGSMRTCTGRSADHSRARNGLDPSNVRRRVSPAGHTRLPGSCKNR